MISKYCRHLIIVKNNCIMKHSRVTDKILTHEKYWCTKCSCMCCAWNVDEEGACKSLKDGSQCYEERLR